MPFRIRETIFAAVCIVALGPVSCERQEAQNKPAPATESKTEAKKMAPTRPGDIPPPPDVAAPPAAAEKTASGLASMVVQAGTGDRHPKPQDSVNVHYTGWTTDGMMFDSSVKRGSPASFPLNGVIKGWTEGLQLMVVGEKRRFWIPAGLAYGETPSRPGTPGGMLVFDVELLAIQ